MPIFAQLAGGGFFQAIVILVVVGIVIGLLHLLIAKAPFIPAEYKVVAQFILYALAILFLIGILLKVAGVGGVPF